MAAMAGKYEFEIMSGTASLITLTRHSPDFSDHQNDSATQLHLSTRLLVELQRLRSDIAIDKCVEIDRLGEVARRYQQIAQPGELVHRNRHVRIDGRILLHFIVGEGGQRIVRFGKRDLARELYCLVTVRKSMTKTGHLGRKEASGVVLACGQRLPDRVDEETNVVRRASRGTHKA